jgi:hypothetical protein
MYPLLQCLKECEEEWMARNKINNCCMDSFWYFQKPGYCKILGKNSWQLWDPSNEMDDEYWKQYVDRYKQIIYIEYSKPHTMNYQLYVDIHMPAKLSQWFIKSDLKRELMEKLWHPANMEKWSGWGYDEDRYMDGE